MDIHRFVPLYRFTVAYEVFYTVFFWTTFCNFPTTLCSGNKNATVSLSLHFFFSIPPSIIFQPKQSKQSCAFSLFQSQMKCHSQEFQMLEISSFVFISYLCESQNRIPLKGISPTVCFKCKTNKFLSRVLRFRVQWKCRVNQMWKYHRVMNISL